MVGIKEALTSHTTTFLMGAAGGVLMDYLLEKYESDKGATPLISQLGEYGTPSKLVPIVVGGGALVAGATTMNVPVLKGMAKTPKAAAGLVGFGLGSLGYMLYRKYTAAPAPTAQAVTAPQAVPVARYGGTKPGIVLTR